VPLAWLRSPPSPFSEVAIQPGKAFQGTDPSWPLHSCERACPWTRPGLFYMRKKGPWKPAAFRANCPKRRLTSQPHAGEPQLPTGQAT
jgi:hypothetical protein